MALLFQCAAPRKKLGLTSQTIQNLAGRHRRKGPAHCSTDSLHRFGRAARVRGPENKNRKKTPLAQVPRLCKEKKKKDTCTCLHTLQPQGKQKDAFTSPQTRTTADKTKTPFSGQRLLLENALTQDPPATSTPRAALDAEALSAPGQPPVDNAVTWQPSTGVTIAAALGWSVNSCVATEPPLQQTQKKSPESSPLSQSSTKPPCSA